MSRKECAEAMEIKEINKSVSEQLADQADQVAREAAVNCSTGELMEIDYMGVSIEALEIDLKKFVSMMSDYVILN